MKKLFTKNGLYISLAILSIFSFCACNKSTAPAFNAQTSTISYILANATNTTIFNAAVMKAGLDSVFNNSTSIFTIFAPNDLACTQSGFPMTVINAFTTAQAKDWVLYQTYAGTALNASSFIGVTEEKLIMANGDSIFVSGDSNRTFVNSIQLLNSQLTASNGSLLGLSYVLTPPTQNLSQMVGSDTTLSLLNAAIQLATQSPDSLGTMLSTGGPFLLLGPDNDAFRKLGYYLPSDLSSANPDSLRAIVLTSLIPRRLFSYDISDSSTFVTVNNSSLLFTNNGILGQVQLQGSGFTSNIIAFNAMAINGVLFKIDEVLGH